MRFSSRRAIHSLVLTTSVLLLCAPALAQDRPDPEQPPATGASPPASLSSGDRLFLSFAEEASVPESQWWEGQFEVANGDATDAIIARGVLAFQVFEDVEFGGRVGFGSTDAGRGLPDGSGATDLDLWAKLRLVGGADTQFAVGGLFTIPTGDDQAGLGFDAFSAEVFGSIRHRLQRVSVAGTVGVRFNDDGQLQGFDVDGRTSPFVAGAVIAPLNDAISFVGELRVEGERYRGLDEDARVLGGVNWRLNNRAFIRAALSLGLTDGAPDSQLIAGFAYTF